MREAIDACKWIFLREIGEPEENSLRLVIEEAKADGPPEDSRTSWTTSRGPRSPAPTTRDRCGTGASTASTISWTWCPPPSRRSGRSSTPNQALQQTAGHDSFPGLVAHRCPAAAELGRWAGGASGRSRPPPHQEWTGRST